jgi:hypothetical protein
MFEKQGNNFKIMTRPPMPPIKFLKKSPTKKVVGIGRADYMNFHHITAITDLMTF